MAQRGSDKFEEAREEGRADGALPAGRTFENVQDLWRALEHRF
jgi:hypothetical protein